MTIRFACLFPSLPTSFLAAPHRRPEDLGKIPSHQPSRLTIRGGPQRMRMCGCNVENSTTPRRAPGFAVSTVVKRYRQASLGTNPTNHTLLPILPASPGSAPCCRAVLFAKLQAKRLAARRKGLGTRSQGRLRCAGRGCTSDLDEAWWVCICEVLPVTVREWSFCLDKKENWSFLWWRKSAVIHSSLFDPRFINLTAAHNARDANRHCCCYSDLSDSIVTCSAQSLAVRPRLILLSGHL
jgi:hypothetical protein